MIECIFYRADGFYTIECKDEEEAIQGAEQNEGTLKVTDIRGNLIWGGNRKERRESIQKGTRRGIDRNDRTNFYRLNGGKSRQIPN